MYMHAYIVCDYGIGLYRSILALNGLCNYSLWWSLFTTNAVWHPIDMQFVCFCFFYIELRYYSPFTVCDVCFNNILYCIGVMHWQKSASNLLEEESRKLKLNGISCSEQTTNLRSLDAIRLLGKVSYSTYTMYGWCLDKYRVTNYCLFVLYFTDVGFP